MEDTVPELDEVTSGRKGVIPPSIQRVGRSEGLSSLCPGQEGLIQVEVWEYLEQLPQGLVV